MKKVTGGDEGLLKATDKVSKAGSAMWCVCRWHILGEGARLGQVQFGWAGSCKDTRCLRSLGAQTSWVRESHGQTKKAGAGSDDRPESNPNRLFTKSVHLERRDNEEKNEERSLGKGKKKKIGHTH